MRPLRLHTPLGDDALLFRSMTLRDALSAVFEAEIEVLSKKPDINFEALLGHPVSLDIELQDGSERQICGHVTRFAQIGREGDYHRYHASVRPWLWFLSRTTDCRVFQNLTVPEIIKQVFGDHGVAVFKDRLTASYPQRVYTIQYRESDLNFVSRLMEEEGIYYYFEHGGGKHTLVLADGIASHSPAPGFEQVPFYLGGQDGGMTVNREHMAHWRTEKSVQPADYVLNDYDFLKPKADLKVKAIVDREHPQAKHEIYDYPGQYVDPGVGEHYARVRIDELQARHERVVGQGPVRGLPVGYLFSLTEHPRGDQNRQYLVAQATLHLSESDYRSGGGEWEAQVDIQALPSNLPFRPERTTPKPIVQGPQTAVIVGPAGEEIWTDEHARVKVQFHWDRRGKKNDQSSCWVRVSQPWAGQNFGMVAIPRIGQEVVVSFLEGDPDQPLITGRVYNADQMPPWDLPGNKTQSGILSRSSQGGHYDHANALRFEDKKGAEEVWLHAEKDQRIEVEHDESHWVGNDRSKTVDHDETVHIKHDRTETVDHDETITVHNNRSERVDHNETISIGDNRDEDVGKNETVTIGKNQTFDVGQSRTKTVGKHEKDKIGRNWSINVGRFKTETINLAFLQNVGLAKMVNIGTVYNRNVGAMMLTTVGASRSDRIANNHTQKIGDNKTVNVGDTYSLTVGEGSHIVMDKDSITLNVGKATLVMKKNGNITLNGHDLNIGMSGDQRLKASGDITLKASKIHEN